MKTHALATGPNWVWETMRDHLGDDIGGRLAVVADYVVGAQNSVLRDELIDMTRMKQQAPPSISGSPEEVSAARSLYPGPDIAPSYEAPWGQYRPESIQVRAEAVAAAAMKCYLELAELMTPNFGDTLGVRGLMPVEFYGNLHYTKSDNDDPDWWGPPEPGLAWLLKPVPSLGRTPVDRISIANSVSLTLNDAAREAELHDERNELYHWHEQRLVERPAYEPFAASFSTHFGHFDILSDRPATRLALRWLWEDLKGLGWVKGMTPRFHR